MKIIIIVTIISVLVRTSFASTIYSYDPDDGKKQEIPAGPPDPGTAQFKVETSARESGPPSAGPLGEELDEIQAKAEAMGKGYPEEAEANQFYSSWPYGRYALPKTTSGCPPGWSTGYRYQDNEDIANSNAESEGIQNRMDVDVGTNTGIHYCVKTTYGYYSSPSWPRGNYCIARKGGYCPSGFSDGSVYWDDEDSFNTNTYNGTLPDGEYDTNTKIYFCCRSDRSYLVSIHLPTSTPFYLYRFGNHCQRVFGMSVVEDFIRTDDQDLGNNNACSGTHPAGSCGRNIQINFCYYRTSH